MESEAIEITEGYFSLAETCRMVTGATHDTIYDLKNRKVYRIKKKLGELIEGCNSQRALSEIFKSASVPEQEGMKYLSQMADAGVGAFTNTPDSRYGVLQEHRGGIGPHAEQTGKTLCLILTGDCNLDCSFCSEDPGAFVRCKGCRRWRRSGEETASLTCREWANIIGEAAELGFNALEIRGGEPLFHSELVLDLFRTANNSGFQRCTLLTNGTMLFPELIDRLKSLGIHLLIQIVSLDPERYESITRRQGVFDPLFENVTYAASSEIPFSIIVPICKENQNEKNDIVQFFSQLCGCFTLCEHIFEHCEKQGNATQWHKPEDVLKFIPDEQLFEIASNGNLCWSNRIAVNWQGAVMPCAQAFNDVVGNTRTNVLAEILNRNKHKAYLQLGKNAIPSCSQCEFRYACPDCRLMVEQLTGSLSNKDPRCGYNPLLGEWRSPP